MEDGCIAISITATKQPLAEKDFFRPQKKKKSLKAINFSDKCPLVLLLQSHSLGVFQDHYSLKPSLKTLGNDGGTKDY